MSGSEYKVICIPVDAGLIIKGFPQKDEDEKTIRYITQALQQTPEKFKVHGIIYPIGTKRKSAVVKFVNASDAQKLIDFGELKTIKNSELKFGKFKMMLAEPVYYISVDSIIKLFPDLSSSPKEDFKYIHDNDKHYLVAELQENLEKVINNVKTNLRTLADQGRATSPSPSNSDSESFVVIDENDDEEDIYSAGNNSVVKKGEESEDAMVVNHDNIDIPKLKEGKLLKVSQQATVLFPEITEFLKTEYRDNIIILKKGMFIIDIGQEHIIAKLEEKFTCSLMQKYKYIEPPQQKIDRNATKISPETGAYLKISSDVKESTSTCRTKSESTQSVTDKPTNEAGSEENKISNGKATSQSKSISDTSLTQSSKNKRKVSAIIKPQLEKDTKNDLKDSEIKQVGKDASDIENKNSVPDDLTNKETKKMKVDDNDVNNEENTERRCCDTLTKKEKEDNEQNLKDGQDNRLCNKVGEQKKTYKPVSNQIDNNDYQKDEDKKLDKSKNPKGNQVKQVSCDEQGNNMNVEKNDNGNVKSREKFCDNLIEQNIPDEMKNQGNVGNINKGGNVNQNDNNEVQHKLQVVDHSQYQENNQEHLDNINDKGGNDLQERKDENGIQRHINNRETDQEQNPVKTEPTKEDKMQDHPPTHNKENDQEKHKQKKEDEKVKGKGKSVQGDNEEDKNKYQGHPTHRKNGEKEKKQGGHETKQENIPNKSEENKNDSKPYQNTGVDANLTKQPDNIKDDSKPKQVDSRKEYFTVNNEVYAFLTEFHEKELKQIEKKCEAKITWLEGETEKNLGILTTANGNEEKRISAENEFIKLYQTVYHNIKVQKVPVQGYKSADIKLSVRKTKKEIKNILIVHKDETVILIGKENDAAQAKTCFKKVLGIPVEERCLKIVDESKVLSEASSDNTDLEIVVGKGIKVIIKCSDITKENVDVIVNAANERLEHGGGVAKAIAMRAGRGIDDEGRKLLRDRRRMLGVSEVVHTGGYKLNAKYVIHAVGPIHGQHEDFQNLLEKTFLNCLEYAERLKATSICIPLISSGNFGGSKRECAKALVVSITFFVEVNKSRYLKEIRLVNIDAEATIEIKRQIDAVSWRNTSGFESGHISEINSESDQVISAEQPQNVKIKISHALLVEGFELYETDGETKFNLAILLHKSENGGGEIDHIVYPVGKTTNKAVVVFGEQIVAKRLIDARTIKFKNHRCLQIHPIDVAHHKEALVMDVSAVSPIIPSFNKINASYSDLDNGKLMFEKQDDVEKFETYIGNEVQEWLNKQASKEKEPLRLSQCVIVTGFQVHKTCDKTRDRIEILMQKRKFGGGDVQKVIYPYGNSTTKAVVIFDEDQVAESLKIKGKITNEEGQTFKIYPLKMEQWMKTYIVKFGDVPLLLEPTLNDSILESAGAKGKFLEDGQRLVLKDEHDVDKIINYVTDKLERLLTTFVKNPSAGKSSVSQEVSPKVPEKNTKIENEQFMIYQFLKKCHRKKISETERNFDVSLTWLPDENYFVVLSNKPGDGSSRKKAENQFKKMYKEISPITTQLDVSDAYAINVDRAAQETAMKHTNVLIIPKDFVFVGSEENVEKAVKYFQNLCGMKTQRHLQDTERLLTDVKVVLERGINVVIRHSDITEEPVDVIVNAANGQLQHGSGVARAIADKAGRGIDAEGQAKLKGRGCDLKVAEVLHTGGFNLKSKYVLHAVGPNRNKQKDYFNYYLEKTFLNCLEYADINLEARSIAIPLISSGIFGGNKDECAQALFNSIIEFQKQKHHNIKEILLVNIDVEATSAIQDVFKKYQERKVHEFHHNTNDTSTGEVFHSKYDQSAFKKASGSDEPSYNDQNQRNSQQEYFSHKSSGQPAKNKKPVAVEQICPICMSDVKEPKTLACGHMFCKYCIDMALSYKPVCPNCGMMFGVLKGNQPPGRMTSSTSPSSLPGYRGFGTITITYDIPSGIQTNEHPCPGKPYLGTTRNAYLPNTSEGRYVAGLLKKAFDARLIFTVGTSITTGIANAVVWNDIHHKTTMSGQPYGYPDPTYLSRVLEELAAKGIK